MKKTILMFAAAGLFFVTPSCKKGEEDPALSLSSRKARLAGEWVLSYMKETEMNDYGAGDKYEETSESTDGSSITTTSITTTAGVAGTPSISTTVIDKAEYIINKDGSFVRDWNTTSTNAVDAGGGVTYTTVTVRTDHQTGSWSFVGKDKTGDYKKNERVLFTVTSQDYWSQSTVTTNDNGNVSSQVQDPYQTSNTYLTGEMSAVFDILQLKGKEMKWVSEGNNVWTETTVSGGSQVIDTDTYTEKTEMTLTHK